MIMLSLTKTGIAAMKRRLTLMRFRLGWRDDRQWYLFAVV